VKDFYAVNPVLGTWAHVEKLADHFALMFDAVFNHMSAQGAWFAGFLARKPGFEQMFVTASPDADLSAVVRPRTSPLLTPFTRPDGEVVHVWTTFSEDQVDINYADPATLLRMLDVLLFYVARGATYIRLDAIAFLWKVIGTSCIHLPQTHAVIRLMRAVLDVVAPQTVLITETNVPHEENIRYFGDGVSEAQMVYNFTLPPLLFHTMLAGDATRLREWVNTLETPSERTTFFNFTASHDGIGMRPVEGVLSAGEIDAMIAHTEATGGRVSYRQVGGEQKPYELNVTYVDAVTDPAEPLSMQVKRFLVTQAIMLAMAGVPAVYVHSLLGSRNDIAGMEQGGRNRLINRAKLDVRVLEEQLADEATFRHQVFEGYRELLRLRARVKAFHPNSAQQGVDVGNPAVFALLRTAATGERVLALHNVTGQPQDFAPVGGLSGERGDKPLSPYEVRWLDL
jgi:sucrose phosphorylase